MTVKGFLRQQWEIQFHTKPEVIREKEEREEDSRDKKVRETWSHNTKVFKNPHKVFQNLRGQVRKSSSRLNGKGPPAAWCMFDFLSHWNVLHAYVFTSSQNILPNIICGNFTKMHNSATFNRTEGEKTNPCVVVALLLPAVQPVWFLPLMRLVCYFPLCFLNRA